MSRATYDHAAGFSAQSGEVQIGRLACRAFNGVLDVHDVTVERDGTVRVYDPVAKHYTTVHSLGPSAIRRIWRIARPLFPRGSR